MGIKNERSTAVPPNGRESSSGHGFSWRYENRIDPLDAIFGRIIALEKTWEIP
jgi:hypothetical protein